MTLLDEFLSLPPVERRMRLGHGDIREAVVALGTEAGVAWLEKQIELPIGPEWGALLYALKSEWKHLERWLRLGKLHGLAAFDALLLFSRNRDSAGYDREPQLPRGADPLLLDKAIASALDHYGNLRLREAAHRIRHTWPVGKPIPQAIDIPDAIKKFAATLFDGDSTLMQQWVESLAAGLNRPEVPSDYWDSLVDFGAQAKVLAVVDWRESPDFISEQLQNLKSAAGLPIVWNLYAAFEGDNELLFRTLNFESKKFRRILVSFDCGSDSYVLFLTGYDRVAELDELLASAFEGGLSMQRFD